MARSRFEAYRVHAHTRPGSASEAPLDYHAFAAAVTQIAPEDLRVSFGDRVIAARSVRYVDGTLSLDLLAGRRDDEILIFDLATGKATTQQLASTQLPVRSVVLAIKPGERLALLEKRRPGVPVAEAERFLALLAARVMSDQSYLFTLAPWPSESFGAEVRSLSRVRSAAIRVARPNMSWTNDGKTLLEKEGEASNAGSLEIEVRANRGESLALDAGLVPEIVELAEDPNPSVQAASVTGVEAGSGDEKTVRLNRHVIHRFREVGKRTATELHEAVRGAIEDVAASLGLADSDDRTT